MANVNEPDFTPREAPAGFRSRRARIGRELGSELIGCSVWEVPPGEAAYPYHFHYSDEEIVIVWSGRPTLRTPDEVRELNAARSSTSRLATAALTRSSTGRPSR